MLLPLSMDEVIAERDLLRAEFAAERRRLQQKMDAQAAIHADELAELGRRATEIVHLKSELTTLKADHAQLVASHDAAVRDLAETSGERGALLVEIHDATGLHQAIRAKFDALFGAHDELTALSEEQRARIVTMETKIEGLKARIEGLEFEVDTYMRRARHEEERAIGLGEERDMLLKEIRSIEQLMAGTQERFETERAHATALQEKLDEQRADVDAALVGQRDAQKAMEAAERARDMAQAKSREATHKLEQQADSARAAEQAAADQMESLRAEIAALKGALAASRDARGSVVRGSADTAQLRDAIAEIGAKVARMAQQESVARSE